MKLKLNKAKLKQVILEVLSESNGITDTKAASSAVIKKTQRGKESQAEVGKLVPRERQVVGALQKIQSHLAGKPGNQATQKVVMLLQRLMDELEKGKDITQGDAE